MDDKPNIESFETIRRVLLSLREIESLSVAFKAWNIRRLISDTSNSCHYRWHCLSLNFEESVEVVCIAILPPYCRCWNFNVLNYNHYVIIITLMWQSKLLVFMVLMRWTMYLAVSIDTRFVEIIVKATTTISLKMR